MSDTGIDVYIPEPGSSGGDENGLFKRGLKSEFTAPFRFVSIGRGAAAAAWVTEVVSFTETYGGYAVGLVIAGFLPERK